MKSYRIGMERMLETIRSYGLDNKSILDAMARVPRHEFVPYELQDMAYDDGPLPIGRNQTISQPYTVALMLDALELKDGQKVLEIGAGSGWNAALLQELVGRQGRVYAVEIIEELALEARENLKKVGSGARIIVGDGSIGLKKHAPYDRIIVTSACPEIPAPLVEQLADGGIIVAPVGRLFQTMIKGIKSGQGLKTESLGSFRFVPLKGRHGF